MAVGLEKQLAEAGDGDGDVTTGLGFIVLVEGEQDGPFWAGDGLDVWDEGGGDGVAEAVFGAIAVVDAGEGDGGMTGAEGGACFFCAFGDQNRQGGVG